MAKAGSAHASNMAEFLIASISDDKNAETVISSLQHSKKPGSRSLRPA
jgi:hypothetical protein